MFPLPADPAPPPPVPCPLPPPPARHHLRTLGRGLLGDARGTDGRGDTVEIGHLLTSVLYVDRLGVLRLLTVGRGVEDTVGRHENHALLGVHVVCGSV